MLFRLINLILRCHLYMGSVFLEFENLNILRTWAIIIIIRTSIKLCLYETSRSNNATERMF